MLKFDEEFAVICSVLFGLFIIVFWISASIWIRLMKDDSR